MTPVQNAIEAYKAHFYETGGLTDELYKWKIVTLLAGKPDLDAEDFTKEIHNLKFNNLIYGPQLTTIRNLAKYQPELYNRALHMLFDEGAPLQLRVNRFIDMSRDLWSEIKGFFNKETKPQCDERLISCLLTCRYPDKYTFYKNDVYSYLCSITGEKPRKTRHKLVHFYEILDNIFFPVVDMDYRFNEAVRYELDRQGLRHSRLLLSQTILWYNTPKNEKSFQKAGFKDNNDIFTATQPIIDKVMSTPIYKKLPEETLAMLRHLNRRKQIILQGAPGTGKTYVTTEMAVALCDGHDRVPDNRKELTARYNELKEAGRIAFTTFHQSMDYEEFIEGIKPQTADGAISYEVMDGIFKSICDRANANFINSKMTPKELDAEISFDEKFDKLIEMIQTGATEKIPLRSNTTSMIVDGISDNNNILLRTQNSKKGRIYIVSAKRLKKLARHYPTAKSLEAVTNIEKSIRGVIGGCNTSAYWAVLHYLYTRIDIRQSEGRESVKRENFVIIIDEINRGNISKILGELITLLEHDKRAGEINELSVSLPYSGDRFSVPSNLYIIGTMNTADRSVGGMDYAVRRRFAFFTVKANRAVVENHYTETGLRDLALEYFDKVSGWISPDSVAADVEFSDLMVGHSYFLAQTQEELDGRMIYEVIPLLREYITDGIISLDRGQLHDWEEQLTL